MSCDESKTLINYSRNEIDELVVVQNFTARPCNVVALFHIQKKKFNFSHYCLEQNTETTSGAAYQLVKYFLKISDKKHQQIYLMNNR